MVRVAFDPAVRGQLSRLLTSMKPALEEQLNWASAWPAGAEERWDCYQHDSGTSVTWAWREASRQNVTSDVLARLLAPGSWPKRVSLQHRPLPAHQAAQALDSQVRAAEFRSEYARRTRRDVTARDVHDHARARQASLLPASWQLPGPDFHRQATTSLRTRRSTMALRHGAASRSAGRAKGRG